MGRKGKFSEKAKKSKKLKRQVEPTPVESKTADVVDQAIGVTAPAADVVEGQIHPCSSSPDMASLHVDQPSDEQRPPAVQRSISATAADRDRRAQRGGSSEEGRTFGASDAARLRGVLSSVSEESDVQGAAPRQPQPASMKTIQGGVNPSFIFLQLFQNQCFRGHADSDGLAPMPTTEDTDKSIVNLDMIPPYETHKIGVICIKPGQTKNEAAILGNMFGSTRYVDFMQRLGDIVRLSDTNPHATYVGGLDHRGTDGPFVYVWQAEFMQVVFHIATMMPCQSHDPTFVEKKKHIGNDYVTIVYNDSGEEYRMGIVKSQFNFVNIVIQPLDQHFNTVTVQTKPEIEDMIGHTDTKIISDANLALLVRQMAVHANLASTIYVRQKLYPMNPYASNWLERLRRVRQMRERLTNERAKSEGPVDVRSAATTPSVKQPTCDDFSDFVK